MYLGFGQTNQIAHYNAPKAQPLKYLFVTDAGTLTSAQLGSIPCNTLDLFIAHNLCILAQINRFLSVTASAATASSDCDQ